jgi:hypothetical protein
MVPLEMATQHSDVSSGPARWNAQTEVNPALIPS